MLCFSDKAGADQLDQRLSEAEKVLGEYVRRLEAEEKERKDLQELLEVFVWQHRQQLRESKKKLKVSTLSGLLSLSLLYKLWNNCPNKCPVNWCPN